MTRLIIASLSVSVSLNVEHMNKFFIWDHPEGILVSKHNSGGEKGKAIEGEEEALEDLQDVEIGQGRRKGKRGGRAENE